MKVDFLDIAPKEVRSATVTVKDQQGSDREVEIFAIDVSDLAKLARKNPAMLPLFAKGAPDALQAIALAEHLPTVIAAGLGHLGDPVYEAAAKRFPHDEQQKLGEAIMDLSFPNRKKPTDDAGGEGGDDPLPPSAAAIIAEATAVAAGEADTASPPPSST